MTTPHHVQKVMIDFHCGAMVLFYVVVSHFRLSNIVNTNMPVALARTRRSSTQPQKEYLIVVYQFVITSQLYQHSGLGPESQGIDQKQQGGFLIQAVY